MKVTDALINNEIIQYINSTQQSTEIIVSGKEDTGKSWLVKNTLQHYKNNPEVYSIYIELSPNLKFSAEFTQNLLLSTYERSVATSLNNVSKGETFKRFLTKRKIVGHIYRQMLRSVNVAGAHLTGTAPLIINDEEYVKDFENINSIECLNLFVKYFKKISNKKKLIIAFSNYKDTESIVNLFLTSLSEKAKKNLFIILSVNSDKNCEHDSYGFLKYNKNYKLKYFDINDINKFLTKEYPKLRADDVKNLSDIIYKNTCGKYSQIITLISKNDEHFRIGDLKNASIFSSGELAKSLDEVQKSLVFLSSIFPDGLKKKYVYEFYNSYNSINELELDSEINELITNNILMYNGNDGDRLKILNKDFQKEISQNYFTEDLIGYLTSIKEYLLNLLLKKDIQNYEYSYILHCSILLFKSNELSINIDKIITAIKLEHAFGTFGYISDLYNQIFPIVQLLPINTVLKILDALQKNSEFEKGLSITQKLTKFGCCDDRILLFEAKYLTQTYEYDEALKIANRISANNNEVSYVKLNILQQLYRDVEGFELVKDIIKSGEHDKWYYIILRNSAHYFNFNKAKENLISCEKFFNKHRFETATIANNLGLVYLWHNDIALAKEKLDMSIKLFSELYSPEIFEPYCNRAVLNFLLKEKSLCLRDINYALDKLPKNLTMDRVLLDVNKILFELQFLIISVTDAIQKLKEINNSTYFADKWTEFLVRYNLYNLSGKEEYKYDSSFLKEIQSTQNTRFEYFYKIKIKEELYNIALGLSPHWRY